MDLARFETAFRDKGFSVRQFPDFLRLVKAHCEVHASATSSTITLKIPVVKTALGEAFPERLLTYLSERNAAPKGPGRFEVEGAYVWCGCEAPLDADITQIAADLVAQVERLGPKILNLR